MNQAFSDFENVRFTILQNNLYRSLLYRSILIDENIYFAFFSTQYSRLKFPQKELKIIFLFDCQIFDLKWAHFGKKWSKMILVTIRAKRKKDRNYALRLGPIRSLRSRIIANSVTYCVNKNACYKWTVFFAKSIWTVFPKISGC